jgi:hypothetical protein
MKKQKPNAAPPAGEALHPGRKEHAQYYISHLEGPKARQYATARLEYIWMHGKKQPKAKGLKAARAQEIDAALFAIFATLR